MAVDGLSSAVDVHRPGGLKDVVWHVARGPTAVAYLPPLLLVVQNLRNTHLGILNVSFSVKRVRRSPTAFSRAFSQLQLLGFTLNVTSVLFVKFTVQHRVILGSEILRTRQTTTA